MKIFYIVTALTFIFALMARIYKNKDNRPNLFWSIIIIIILVLVSGLRSNIGDTGAYKYLYQLVVSNKYTGGYEFGFIIFLEILTHISQDPQIMIFITAFITNVLNILTLRTYSKVFEFEIYMYITAGYYITTMNGIRQGMVASIIFACTKFIIEDKFKMYLLVVLIASTIHTSALIMIPAYFIVKKETWSKSVVCMILFMAVAFIIFQPLMENIFMLLEGSRYSGYQSDILTGGEGGANPLRIVISSIPVILSYIGRKKIKEEWNESNIFINMSIINLIIMVFSMKNWVFARFSFYFELYNFILLPYLINLMFDKKLKRIIYNLFIVFYFIYMYRNNVVSQGIEYKSNFININ